MATEHLCLKWNNFESNIASFLDVLRSGNDFVDVTITCENTNFKAHKLILSACSPYFKSIFQDSPCQHPVIILKNVHSQEMEAILRYIYTGETHVTEDNLQSFLQTAHLLQIIGLAQPDDKPHSLTQLRARWRGRQHSDGANDDDKKKEGQEDVLNRSKSFSSFEASEDESVPRKRSTESEGEPVGPWKIWNKSAEERKKLWVGRGGSKTLPPLKKRTVCDRDRGNTSECEEELPLPAENGQTQGSDEDPCPILSKQLLLPKKRKVSPVLDQNKNVELVSEHSDSSEADVVVKAEPQDHDHDDEDNEGGSVLEPEVGLSIKDDDASDSEDSLPNGDILLQRLKGPDSKGEDNRILRVPNPDVSIFSHRLVHPASDSEAERSESFTLAPNVDVFLKNTNNSENLLSRLGKINLFKAKRKPSRPDASTSKQGEVQQGGVEGKLHLSHLPCPHCAQLYNNLSALKYHVRLMHSDLENKLFCYLCPMNFIERDFFKMHLWEVHHARF